MRPSFNNVRVFLIKHIISFKQVLLFKKEILLFLLITTSLAFLFLEKIDAISKLIIYLFLLINASYIFQIILVRKKSFAFYFLRWVFAISLIFEIIFGSLKTDGIKYNYDFATKHSMLGYINKSDCKEKFRAILYKDTIFDVCFSFDKYGRRISCKTAKQNFHNNLYKHKHAIFLGCSYILGDGLEYCSTIPHLFEIAHPEYISYNYGTQGHGPNQLCFLFDEGINTINNQSVPEDSGFCIYTYINDHLNRVCGIRSFHCPREVYINNNRLTHLKRKYLKNFKISIFDNSETLKFFNIKQSYPKTEEFYKRFADIINYMANKYLTLKPSGVFYIALYPENINDTKWIKYLNKEVKILNIPFPKDYDNTYRIRIEGHPAKPYNDYFVSEITKSIIHE